MNDEMKAIDKHLIGLKLVDVEGEDDELRLVFQDGKTLFITGGYNKTLWAQIKQRSVTYGPLEGE